ncbi:Macrolide export ATP-binding/permease protein MacB [Anaerohalosphaera lusitana]|uniref:Macrolide export ATP-binding/permease protein MacB n=1 Tax=Anaerohalosphaera lusitana TaxID=1936003 RepID=A0A1U9NP70_9BACT|nr:ABC transporter ATP-binding protein [Anaerohalosphaera lusitana]AQT69711.1 Macrolide export ATP-binding/permease protein MacB [Anaerohalosphaera lusitana]
MTAVMEQNDGALLRLEGIQRIYAMGVERVHALAGVDIDIEPGEYVAIMGPSGSGKSTLMNVLGCLDKPTAGRYELAGKDVSKLSGGELAHIRNTQIGFVFQSFELLPRINAMRNVELPLIYSKKTGFRKRRKLVHEALQRVGLGGRMNHRPNQLSGGEKQRVAIARAIICGPSILLADEPTGNLDTKTSESILELFDKLHGEGQTIIMVTHEEDVAQRSKRIIRMQDGGVMSDELTARGRDA